MKTVRDFLDRLAALSPDEESRGRAAFRHRRIVVPEAARFALQNTLVRTLPVEPQASFSCPGGPTESVQLLEWLDLSEEGQGIDPRDNDLGVDLTAILALAAGRRVVFANEFPLKYEMLEQTLFLPFNQVFDVELYGPADPAAPSRFTATLKAIANLPERQAFELGGAIRARNAACCLVQSDHSTAYGLLVVALETLSRAFGDPATTWNEWDQAPDWDKFFLGIAVSGQQAARIREKLLANKQIRLKRTFVEYVVSGLSADFWSERYFRFTQSIKVSDEGYLPDAGTWDEAGTMAELVPSDERVLRRRLGKSYDARSEVFHQGARLDSFGLLLPVPSSEAHPLPFAGLRRVLDHLLWREIGKATKDAADLPDIRILHPSDSSE